jgi:hypothetical protein
MRRKVEHWSTRDRRTTSAIEPVTTRLPDRGGGYFGNGRWARLTPPGRPSDIFGDVIVTVARVRAMESTE